MNYNIHCKKSVIEKKIEEFFEKGPFKISNIQTYYPIMDNYYRHHFKNNSNLEFKNRYNIRSIFNEQLDTEYNFRSNKIYSSMIYDNYTKKTFKKDVFFKMNSILNPITFIKDKYSWDTNTNLPFYKKDHMRKINKLLRKNNSAYIDSFCTFICGKIVDNNLCPNFPKYFGSYCGVMEKFWFDLSDEYEIYNDKDWFQENLKNNKFEISKVNKSNVTIHKNSFSSLESKISENSNLINKNLLEKLELLENTSLTKFSSFDNLNESESNSEQSTKSGNSLMEIQQSENNIIIEGEQMEFENNLIETISNLSMTSVSNNSMSCEPELVVYGVIKDVPVNCIITECLDGTLEQILSKDKRELDKIDSLDIYSSPDFKKIEKRWISYMWQISFALAIAQKYIKLTHNDLHSNNIMFKKTNLKYLYYEFNKNYYQVPTHGYILKIIDFGRAVFKLNEKIYFSDVFEFNGDAGEQYSYPYEKSKMSDVYPNMSFDLSRLSSSIFDDLFPIPPHNYEFSSSIFNDENSLYNLLFSWINDKSGNLVTRFDDFNLYKTIARDVNSAIPHEQLKKEIFNIFKVDKLHIPKKEMIYKY